MSATIPLGSVAAAMGRAGLHVFPVWPGQKRPATKSGWKAATTDPERIARWWAKVPHANIGIATGPSRLVVLDCDAGKPWPLDGQPPEGVRDGADVLQLLAEEHGDADLLHRRGALSVATPSGGLHLYFGQPKGGRVKSSAGRLGPWLDVRALGGYVVAPFSSTPAGHYRPILGWERVVTCDADADFRPIGVPAMDRIQVAPPPLPDWLTGLLRPKDPEPESLSMHERLLRALDAAGPVGDSSAYASAALTKECEAVASAKEGTRNHTLNRAAFALGTIVGAGLLPEAEATSALLAAARSAGLPEWEAVACVRSGMRAGVANPRALHGLPDPKEGARTGRSGRNLSSNPPQSPASPASGTPLKGAVR